MSFRISVQNRNGNTTWGVIHETWVEGKRVDKRIPKDQMNAHGFRPDMPVEDARAWAKQLNAQHALQKQELKKKLAALAKTKKIERIKSAYLPEAKCEEFELTVLFKRLARNNPKSSQYRKALSHWVYIQRMIADLTERGLVRDTSQWGRDAIDFYNYFIEKKTSPKYVTKLIRVLNFWGDFISGERRFNPVPCPRGSVRSDIEDAYLQEKGRSMESDPLTPEMLESTRTKFIVPGQYEWLFVSVHLGLRPSEIDKLEDRTTWTVFRDKQTDVDVLRIYQGKLKNIARDKRDKHIPIIYPEQEKAIEYIKAGGLKRPLAKTLKKIFPGHVTLYGGRKNFTDMMLDREQSPEDISMWLGHKSVETTWKHYKDRNVVRFKKPVPKKAA